MFLPTENMHTPDPHASSSGDGSRMTWTFESMKMVLGHASKSSGRRNFHAEACSLGLASVKFSGSSRLRPSHGSPGPGVVSSW